MVAQAEGFYEVKSVCKDDVRSLFKDNPKALEKIDSLTDVDMNYLASKFGDALSEDAFTILKIVFEERFL